MIVRSFVEKCTYPHSSEIDSLYNDVAVVFLGRFCSCQTVDIHRTLLLLYFGPYLP
jgi:hypothetical protein